MYQKSGYYLTIVYYLIVIDAWQQVCHHLYVLNVHMTRPNWASCSTKSLSEGQLNTGKLLKNAITLETNALKRLGVLLLNTKNVANVFYYNATSILLLKSGLYCTSLLI